MSHLVVRYPDKYLDMWLDYQYTRLPDLSAGIEYTPDDLCFWRNKDVHKSIQRMSPHGTLSGFCGKWANTSYDFAMARLSFQNTHLVFKTHIWLFKTHIWLSKHTFGFQKHTFGFSKHTFGFSKHTFGFQNTHLAFKTHIWLSKTHICFKEQSPREVQKKTKCKEDQHGDLFHFDVVVLLHRSDAREAKTGIGLLSKAFVLLAVEPTAGGQGLEKQAAAVQLCFFFRRGEGRPAGLDTRGRGRT